MVAPVTVEIGTDVACLSAADASWVDPEFDYSRLPAVEAHTAARHGALILCGTGSDGEFEVDIYSGQPPSSFVLSHCRRLLRVDEFPILSGELWCAGLEYACAAGVVDNGSVVAVTPGEYGVDWYRVVSVGERVDEQVNRMAPWGRTSTVASILDLGWRLLGLVALAAVFLGFPFESSGVVWHATWVAAVLCFFGRMLMYLSRPFRRRRALLDTITRATERRYEELEMPDYIIVLNRLASAE